MPLKKPFVVLKKTSHLDANQNGNIKSSSADLEVVGIIRHKILFKSRPKALISSMFSLILLNILFFFFLISKKTNILKEREVHSSTQEVDKRNQPIKKQKPISYLLPNQVRKSTTEFVLSSLDTLTQAHILVTKFDLIF